MSGRRRLALTRAGWWLWRALLLLNTLGLLTVGLYIALASSDGRPGATPLLMAGLLSLCVIVLAVVSAVDAALWASRRGSSWWAKVALIALAPAGAVLVFLLAVYASDPDQARSMKSASLLLFLLAVVAAHGLNAHAIRRYGSH